MNVTNTDWPLKACVTGNGFSGPKTILAKANVTTKYPLMFKPLKEEDVTVSDPVCATDPPENCHLTVKKLPKT